MNSRVNIRPGVSVLSVLRHLNYEPWFALAEFVDNAIQSYIDNFDRIVAVEGKAYRLNVEILLNSSDNTIIIRDNAGGIPTADYHRAFKTAAPPTNRQGLSEFGMGMKSAACWFAPLWEVRTSALGEVVEGIVRFNIDSIVQQQLEDVAVEFTQVGTETHYTEVTLFDVYRIPQARTITKIREHLSSIYREFLRKRGANISVAGVPLAYTAPAILVAPYYKTPDETPREWKQNVDIRLDNDHRIHGYAAIREKASTSQAGFALFRRSRVIQGSADQGYRPELIFGKSNSFRFQRLFGELHFEGFDVSHTKDGFRWDEYEEPFLRKLREQLSKADCQLLEQAEGHRVRPPKADVAKLAETVLQSTENVVVSYLPEVVPLLEDDPNGSTPPETLNTGQAVATRTFDVTIDYQRWQVGLELTSDASMGSWYEISEHVTDIPMTAAFDRVLKARLSLSHPFTLRYAQTDNSHLEPMMRLAVALCIAESQARAGAGKVGSVRMHLNSLLRHIFSKV